MKYLLAALLLFASPVSAGDCRDVTFDDNDYSLCRADVGSDDLRLFLSDSNGEVYGHFSRLNGELATQGKAIQFAMNAGMYHADRSPVGHYVEKGVEQYKVIASAGPGNFGLLPNGVLCIAAETWQVIETLTYQANRPVCDYATQSGPMLVIDGKLHPRFLRDGTSRYIRNGVGTSEDGKTAYFVISNDPVSFYEFGQFFRTYLRVPQALYFDGNVSRLYAPQIGRADLGRQVGPIVAVIKDTE